MVAFEERLINRQPIVHIDVAALASTRSLRLSGHNAEHVQTLVTAQNPLPPIIVHRPSMRVIDGVHRVLAAIHRGERTIAARFFDGDDAAAFVLAVRLNLTHGLPLALADRKSAAEQIITSNPQWSDRRVASIAGISPGTVADIRRRVGGEPAGALGRLGQDGRVRPLDVTAGRLRAGQLLHENPHLSLREVARAAAISPETARDVRNRLRNGEDLVPSRQGRQGRPAGARPPTPRRADAAPLSVVHPSAPWSAPVLDRASIVDRLRADPALRYSDTGRNLLRLLALHSQWTAQWDSIVNNLPPHCSGVLAELAREFADLWTDCATHATREIAEAG